MSRGRYRRDLARKLIAQRHNLNPYGIFTMADFRDIYKTPLLSAKTLGKKTFVSTISMVYPETITDDKGHSKDTLIIELDDGDVRISLNKTNATELADAFGRDYNEWQGRKVKIGVTKREFMGKPCDGLLVSPVKK